MIAAIRRLDGVSYMQQSVVGDFLFGFVVEIAKVATLTQSYNLCWKGIGRTPTLGIILKNNEKLIKNWNGLLLFRSSETNKFNQKQFG